MVNSNTAKVLSTVFICLLLGASEVLACSCGILSAENSFEKSSFVFSAKVVGFEYRKGIPNPMMDSYERSFNKKIDYETLVVKFQVKSYWKGAMPSETILLTDATKNSDGTSTSSSCDYRFKKDETYLVYASGNLDELRTNFCMRTRPIKEAEDDLRTLGEGQLPIEEKPKPDTNSVIPAFDESLLLQFYNESLIKNFAPNGRI